MDVRTYPIALLSAALLSAHSLRSSSLTRVGAAVAFIVGYLTFATPTPVFGAALLAFFFAGNKATKYKRAIKSRLDASEEGGTDPAPPSNSHGRAGGGRDGWQVLCNSVLGTLSAVAYRYYAARSVPQGGLACPLTLPSTHAEISTSGRTLIWTAVAFWGACGGDTLASELGILSKSRPLLITSLRTVPPGTNGGVSSLGLFFSLIGGSVVGLVAAITIYCFHGICPQQDYIVLTQVGAIAGVLGSALDSLLGATLQQSLYSKKQKKIVARQTPVGGDDEVVIICGSDALSNNQVNVLSSTMTGLLAGAVSLLLS